MKQIIDHLRKHWVKYGFETVAIVVGILGAFELSNWSENQKLRNREVTYLTNLKGDLERQLTTIELQIEFEQEAVSKIRGILDIIQAPPYDTKALDSLLGSSARRTFVVDDPVFEDLKYSGNLAIISDVGLRNSLLLLYQKLEYTEKVIDRNNEMWIDRTMEYVVESGIADFGYLKSIQLSNLPVIALDSLTFPGAGRIAQERLENESFRFTLHNKLSYWSKVSKASVLFMEEVREQCSQMIQHVSMQLEQLQ